MTDPQPFRVLRDRIRRLPDMLDRDSAPLDREDREVVARARAFAAALRASRPVAPPELSNDNELERVFDRVTRDSARAIGPSVLRSAFAPATTPRDVAWVQTADRTDLFELLHAGLPHLPLRRERFAGSSRLVTRPSRVRQVVALAAAMLVAAGAFVVFRGTSALPEPVFEVADSPLSADHPSDFLRGLVDR